MKSHGKKFVYYLHVESSMKNWIMMWSFFSLKYFSIQMIIQLCDRFNKNYESEILVKTYSAFQWLFRFERSSRVNSNRLATSFTDLQMY